MSIPPNNLPPGGYSSMPPARPSGGGKGWKIFGFGCLGLFLLAAIGGVILVRSVKNSFAHPNKNSIIGVGVMAGQAALDGVHLQQAVVAYHTQHNAYPKSLNALYTEGSIDGKLLHNNLDDSADPAHVSWTYTPPTEGAPGRTVILEEPYHTTFGGANTGGKIAITLDGKSQTSTSRQTNPSGTGSQGQ